MRKLIAAALLIGAGISGAAYAEGGDFFATRKDCDQIKAKQAPDGVLCTVDGYGTAAILYVLVLTKATDPQADRDRAQYAIGVMSRNFYAAGGRQVAVRLTNKEGKQVERSCFRNSRCGDWFDAPQTKN